MRLADANLITPAMVGREFAVQIQKRCGGALSEVRAELVERDDSFGPVRVIEVRWAGRTFYLSPSRSALSLSLDDYSRLFVQPIVEEWLMDMQRLARA